MLLLFYCQMIAKILFVNDFHTKNTTLHNVDKKGQASNWDKYNQMDGQPYFIVREVIHSHFIIMIDAFLLQNKNERKFIQKRNFTYNW